VTSIFFTVEDISDAKLPPQEIAKHSALQYSRLLDCRNATEASREEFGSDQGA
jgi:hypothetical protein